MIQSIPGLQKGGTLIRRLYDWMGTLVHTKYGIFVLMVFFFLEAIIIVPAGPLLLLFCSERSDRSFFFSALATLASVAGGMVGYFIGHSVWDVAGERLVALVTTPEKFAHLCNLYEENEGWAIMLAGMSPLPYQLITLTAGFCRISFVPFVFYSLIVRSIRLFLIGTVMFIWGKQIKLHIDRYFNKLVLIFVALLVATFVWIM